MILTELKRAFKFLLGYKILCWVLLGLVLAIILKLLHHYLLEHLLISSFLIIALIPLAMDMLRSIRAGRYGIDLPGVIASIFAIVLHQFLASFIIVVVLIVNEKLKQIILERVHKRQSKLLAQIPTVAHVIRKHKLVDIQINDVRIGEEIEIKPGEIIPLDAIILKGSGEFNESVLSGDSKLQQLEIGENILCGAINVNGNITAKVLRPASESQYHQLIRMQRTAVNSTAPFALQADRYSVMFMLAAYMIAAAVWLLTRQPLRFLETIIVVSPITFSLAPMIALTNGLDLASKNGIFIRTNSIFERLARAKTLAFAKAATLVNRATVIDSVTAFKPYKQSDVETYAGSMLQRSNHVLAQAVKNAMTDNKIKLLKTKHIKELSGYGAEARIGSKQVIVGNFGLIKERGIDIPKQFKLNAVVQSAMFIGINGSLIGHITFKDSYRADIKSMLESLKKLGAIKTLMITDEVQSIAMKIVMRLGITDVKSGVRSGDELLAIEAVEDRPLVFIGNGLNDESLLTAADVGIAIGARGIAVAGGAADIVIMQDDLSHISLAMAIAKRTFRLVRQAILVAVGLSLILVLVLATGKVQPIEGAFIRAGIEAVVFGFIWLRRGSSAQR